MAKANEFLRALQANGGSRVETVDAFRERQQSGWLSDLDALCSSIEGWLTPVVAAGAAKVSREDILIHEPDTGEYSAPRLRIEMVIEGQTKIALIRPRGLRIVGLVAEDGKRVVGAHGRVDVECDLRRAILLRFQNAGATRWKSYTLGDGRELDEDLFFDLLSHVTYVALS